ncbi:hypothetical protein CH063_12367 [Colletotrichum higginsianum]|uniref:Uncharacterized protein n=1 Tax=Colletotrichum higginsianum (strain IMI 349063) TaxID=759273 RepID=H1VQ33_COLHI|nr:hypothetical protein CH063_12367 [Colletotrichum higginsianum]
MSTNRLSTSQPVVTLGASSCYFESWRDGDVDSHLAQRLEHRGWLGADFYLLFHHTRAVRRCVHALQDALMGMSLMMIPQQLVALDGHV